MQQESRLHGQRVDLSDGRAKSRGHIVVRGFVEADVAVADLHEEELAFFRRLGAQAGRARDAAADRPEQACPDPRHAAQKVAAIQAVCITSPILGLIVRGIGVAVLISSGKCVRVMGVRHLRSVSR